MHRTQHGPARQPTESEKKKNCIPHKYIAALMAVLYIAYSLGISAYICAALSAGAYIISILYGHEPLSRRERTGAWALMLAALVALALALGAAGLAPTPPAGAVQEVWV